MPTLALTGVSKVDINIKTTPTKNAKMGDDPCNWDVHRVQQFFQQDAFQFLASRPGSQLPPLDTFVQALADLEVDGASLLDAVDATCLRDELGIKSIRVRGTILHCIRELRSQSMNYKLGRQPQTPVSLLATPFFVTATAPEVPTDVILSREVPTGENIRPGEHEIVDEHGRKRRKLDLTSTAPGPSATDVVVPRTNPPEDASAYLHRSALPVDETFFGNTAFGRQVIQNKLPSDVDCGVCDTDSKNRDFQFAFPPFAAGTAQVVYKRLQHYFCHNDQIELERRGRCAIAVFPYKDRLDGKPRSVLVVQAGEDGEYVATKEQSSLLKSGIIDSGIEQESTGEWDFLLEKYQASDDTALPKYGESEIGNAQITDSETADDEGGELASEGNDETLEASRISQLIGSYVAAHAAAWRKKSLPRLEEKKAWSVWKKMKQSKIMRQALIDGARAKIAALDVRLQILKDELLKDEWNGDAALQKACANLEPTVEDREEQVWMLQVWQRRKEPPRTINNKSTITHHPPRGTANGQAATHAFHVHPNDRMSVSPKPAVRAADNVGVVVLGEGSNDSDDESQFRTPPSCCPVDDFPPDFIVSDARSDDGPSVAAIRLRNDLYDVTMLSSSPAASGHPRAGAAPLLSRTPSEPSLSIKSIAQAQASDSDENLASPSLSFPSPIIKKQPGTSFKAMNAGNTDLIDLTLSDSAETPPSNKRGRSLLTKSSSQPSRRPRLDGDPFSARACDVDAWDYNELAKQSKRIHILTKLLKDAGANKRQGLHNLVNGNVVTFVKHLRAGIESRTLEAVGDAGGSDLMIYSARLAVAWHALQPCYVGDQVPARARQKLLSDGRQLKLFADQLLSVLKRKDSRLFVAEESRTPSKATQGTRESRIVIDDDSDDKPEDHNKRKRRVRKSKRGTDMREAAHNRDMKFREMVESQQQTSSQLVALDGDEPSTSGSIINLVRAEGDDPIYIDESLTTKMKPHQITGVQFMWNNITAGDDEEPQGCLLAHTMGLGKTLQAIALLVTLHKTSVSKKKNVRHQLPQSMQLGEQQGKRQLRMLILCPPSLTDNWRRELSQWAPKTLRDVWIVEASNPKTQIDNLENWHEAGGVLLIGYSMFRSLTSRKEEKKRTLDGDRLEQILLKGPDIVIADEAHLLKNPDSGLSRAAGRIETHTRIALTGTPMSNDVDEIYALISWVSPGYLGDKSEFNALYAEPIKEGTYEDSSIYERRKSLKRLKVLHANIKPKVDRADITVLRGSLKTKVEFNITVSLTDEQKALYTRCVTALLEGGEHETASQVTLFSWLGLLMLLTNHPAAFRRKLLSPAPAKRLKNAASADVLEDDGSNAASDAGGDVASKHADLDIDPGEQNLYTLGFTDAIVQAILADSRDSIDASLSAKMEILMEILHLSQKCGDKVLIFSGSIMTLDYVHQLLRSEDIMCGRIDGNTKIQQRAQVIQQLEDGRFNVMLISTRTGGVGLNMQAANRVVILDFSFNPSAEEQAIGRAYRLGQQKPVFVYRFVTGGTFEDNIYNKQLFKTELTQRVVDKKNPKRNATRNAREWLYAPRPVKQNDIAPVTGKDPSVLDRLLNRHVKGGPTHMKAIQLVETLQAEADDDPLNEEEKKEVEEEIRASLFSKLLRKAGAAAVAGLSSTPGMATMPPPPVLGSSTFRVLTNNQPTPRPDACAALPASDFAHTHLEPKSQPPRRPAMASQQTGLGIVPPVATAPGLDQVPAYMPLLPEK